MVVRIVGGRRSTVGVGSGGGVRLRVSCCRIACNWPLWVFHRPKNKGLKSNVFKVESNRGVLTERERERIIERDLTDRQMASGQFGRL